MRISIFVMLAMLLLSCNKSKVKNESNNDSSEIFISNLKCNQDISPVLEIWSHTSDSFIIGDWANGKDKYIQSYGWDSQNSPYPKKFDIKFMIVNNSLLYGDANHDIKDWTMTVIMKFKVSKNEDAIYPLNSLKMENIQLFKDKAIVNEDFKGAELKDHIEFWHKDVQFEKYYNKFKEQGLYINQIIFEINLACKESEENCNYEYTYQMLERGE